MVTTGSVAINAWMEGEAVEQGCYWVFNTATSGSPNAQIQIKERKTTVVGIWQFISSQEKIFCDNNLHEFIFANTQKWYKLKLKTGALMIKMDSR